MSLKLVKSKKQYRLTYNTGEFFPVDVWCAEHSQERKARRLGLLKGAIAIIVFVTTLLLCLLIRVVQAQQKYLATDKARVFVSAEDMGSGVKAFNLSVDNENWDGWTDYNPEISPNVSELDFSQFPDGLVCGYVKFRDAVGHETEVISACEIKDTSPPENGCIGFPDAVAAVDGH